MTKQTKWPVCPAMTQISLGIHPVWSESSLCAQWVAKDPSFLHANTKDSDQTGQLPRLIWVFAGHTGHFLGFVMLRFNCLTTLGKTTLPVHQSACSNLCWVCKKLTLSLSLLWYSNFLFTHDSWLLTIVTLISSCDFLQQKLCVHNNLKHESMRTQWNVINVHFKSFAVWYFTQASAFLIVVYMVKVSDSLIGGYYDTVLKRKWAATWQKKSDCAPS